MKKVTIIFIYALALVTASAQNTQSEGSKTGGVSTSYDRNAVTVIVLDNHTKYISDLKQASAGIIIPSKYDDNLIGTRYVSAKADNKAIRKVLQQKKIPNDILTKWFSRNESGKFDMSVIHDRGMYNATDDEVKKASGSKIGLAKLKDAGEILINHSYILVMEFNNIQTMEQKYNKRDAAKKALSEKLGTEYEPVNRRKNGWVGDVKAYLYRLSFNDSIMNIFYNDLWIYDDDDEATIAAKKAKFDEMVFPLSFVMEANGKADGSQYNVGEILAPPTQLTRDELFQKMIHTGMSSVLFNIERKVEEFKVKTPLYGTHPLRAKVGKKEGLKADHRYFVLEFEQNRKGETVAKRKGVVRAKKVVNNTKVATGSSKLYTTFYQTAGHSLMEGMLLTQSSDFGIGASGGFTLLGKMGGVYVKGEVNVSILAGIFGGLDLGLNQVKIYGVGAFQTKEYSLLGSGTKYDMNFTRFHVGISKGWYFAHSFSIAPFVGYGIEQGTNTDWIDDNSFEDDQFIGTQFLAYGAYLTINITHCMQAVGTLNMYSPIGYAYNKDDESWTNNGAELKYSDVFDKRKGMSIDVGLRIEF